MKIGYQYSPVILPSKHSSPVTIDTQVPAFWPTPAFMLLYYLSPLLAINVSTFQHWLLNYADFLASNLPKVHVILSKSNPHYFNYPRFWHFLNSI